MGYFYILVAVAIAVWVVAVGCSLVSLRLGWQHPPRRFAAAVVLAAVGSGLGFLGRNFHLTYSQTVNGRGWKVDSSWFFWVPLILGGTALALALWQRWRQPSHANSAAPPKLSNSAVP